MLIPSKKDVVCGEVLRSLRRIIRAVDSHSRKLVASHKLTTPQLIVLREISGAEQLTAGNIACKVNLSKATVSGILDRLEKRGLVTRERNGSDKRQVWIRCSNKGETLLESSPPLLQEKFVNGFLSLDESKQAQLMSSTELLASLMDAADLDVSPMLASAPLVEQSMIENQVVSSLASGELIESEKLVFQISDDITIQCIRSLNELNDVISLDKMVNFLHESLKPYQDSVQDIRRGLTDALDPKSTLRNFVLLAIESGKVVGALVMLSTNMKGYIPSHLLLFACVAVEYRGCGIGKHLIQQSLELTEGSVKLHVEPDNPARGIYRKMGFTEKYCEMRFER